MNRKVKLLLATILAGSLLNACNSEISNRNNPTNIYGQLQTQWISHINNPALVNKYGTNNSFQISTQILQDNVESQMICTALYDPSKGAGPFGIEDLCGRTKNYINSNTAIFGLSNASNVNNFILNNASSVSWTGAFGMPATITGAQFESIAFTAPGAPYMFTGNSVINRTQSGLIVFPTYMPFGSTFSVIIPAAQIKGIVIYYHPTILSKSGVPSGIGNLSDGDDLSSLNFQYELAATYASAGYIVISPDYIGQGIDTDETHPYVVFPEANALSGIYMLKATNDYLSKFYNRPFNTLGESNLFIASYSEGGAYALKAAQLVQSGGKYETVVKQLGLHLQHTVGEEGAYNLTEQMEPFAFANNITYPESQNTWKVSPGLDHNLNPDVFESTGGTDAVTSIDTAYLPGTALTNPLGALPESQVQMLVNDFAQLNLIQSKPPLAAYMMNALIHYDYTPVAYNLAFINNYAAQQTCINPMSLANAVTGFIQNSMGMGGEIENFDTIPCGAIPVAMGGLGTNYSISQLFSSTGLTNTQIGEQLVLTAMAQGYFTGGESNLIETFKQIAKGNPQNSMGYFVNPELLNDDGAQALASAGNVYNWTTNAKLTLVNLKFDSTLSPANWLSACSNITETQAGLFTCQQVDNTQLWGWTGFGQIGGTYFGVPMYMGHGEAEGVMQISALNHFMNN